MKMWHERNVNCQLNMRNETLVLKNKSLKHKINHICFVHYWMRFSNLLMAIIYKQTGLYLHSLKLIFLLSLLCIVNHLKLFWPVHHCRQCPRTVYREKNGRWGWWQDDVVFWRHRKGWENIGLEEAWRERWLEGHSNELDMAGSSRPGEVHKMPRLDTFGKRKLGQKQRNTALQ